jgi:DNA-binding transcriptional LysR family regulator
VLWDEWLTLAGSPQLESAVNISFDHIYLVIDAAANGLGVAMWTTILPATGVLQRKELNNGT